MSVNVEPHFILSSLFLNRNFIHRNSPALCPLNLCESKKLKQWTLTDSYFAIFIIHTCTHTHTQTHSSTRIQTNETKMKEKKKWWRQIFVKLIVDSFWLIDYKQRESWFFCSILQSKERMKWRKNHFNWKQKNLCNINLIV